MFRINGREFAPMKERETTAEGYYRRTKDGVHLYDRDRRLRAYVQANDRFTGVVTAGIHNGKHYYMFSTCPLTEHWLGLDQLKYGEERQIVINALEANK